MKCIIKIICHEHEKCSILKTDYLSGKIKNVKKCVYEFLFKWMV